MAEQILFSLAEKVVLKLGSYALKHVKMAWEAKKELQKLETTMCIVRNILPDAEKKQELNRAVKEWLPRLKDILYEADDLVDEFSTEISRRGVEIHGNKRKEVSNFFSSSNPIMFSHWIGRRVKGIRPRLEEVLKDMKQFDFVVQAVETKPPPRGGDETYAFVRSSEVIGREVDVDNILKTLLENGDQELMTVLPIVGLGVFGKTTLAQLIYNDERVESHFQKLVWVCVSDDFEVKRIIVQIPQALGNNNCDRLGLEPLQRKLREELTGVKFFLVLDDVWNEDRVEWIKLRDLLTVGSVESKIIVTTRSKTVASIMGTVPSYDLKGLSDDNCLIVFNKLACNAGAENRHQNLVNIGKEMVKKCHGVPLAARTLGGLLYMKTEE